MSVPSVSMAYGRSGAAKKRDEMGMRPMQARAYMYRGEQYLLIKSPPASGKSRALMFIALDKLHRQGLRQAIVIVPERAIAASFADASLSADGFWTDWSVAPPWRLCDAPGGDGGGKVDALIRFLGSDDRTLVCTHATFRFAVERAGVEAFDDRLIAIDEFHHVAAVGDNKLGAQLTELIARDKAHIVAMTGSYFRGDARPILEPGDEAKFKTVTYTYFEQLQGYDHLEALDIGYFFYSGDYGAKIGEVLNPREKTIVHIPNVNSRESSKDKLREVDAILGALGVWRGVDPETGFHLIDGAGGRVLRVADLVEDEPAKRSRVLAALRDPACNQNRDHVDVIIALGMAKEGFDWIWCEHALTVGYRASLTEVVQIIGRATRDAPGKKRTRFTNLIAEPDAEEGVVTDAVNDTLKAIAASLLMEQVLSPKFDFVPKAAACGPVEGLDYGEGGYDPARCNVGFDPAQGRIQMEIKGLAAPQSPDAKRICREDLTEVVAAFVQDERTIARGLFDHDLAPEELTIAKMGKIVEERYPELDDEDQEAVRQHAIAALNITQTAKQRAGEDSDNANMALIDGVRRFAMDVRELDIDLIDGINPFGEAYAIMAKAMDAKTLEQVSEVIGGRGWNWTPDEAKAMAKRAAQFKRDRNRLPGLKSPDAWERKMAEGVIAFHRFKEEGRYVR